MVKIIKGDMIITKEKNNLVSFTETPDGLYIKCMDDTEIIIPVQLNPSQKAAIIAVTRMNVKGFTIDLNSRTKPVSVEM